MNKYYHLADYILNHYDCNSEADKLVLAEYLQKRFNNSYNNGLNTAISLIKDNDVAYTDHGETLICGLESSKLHE